MRRVVLTVFLSVLTSLGCGDDGGQPEMTDGGTSTAETGAGSSSTTAESTSGPGTTSSTASTSSTTGGDPTTDGTTSGTGTGTETTGGFAGPGCPGELPAGWILCEDFEAVGGPDTYFGNFWTTADLMSVEDGVGVDGGRGLRVGHDPNTFSSGMADIRFGQGPAGGMVHAPDDQFRDVWVRFVLQTGDGWPDAGIAEAVEVMSVAGNARAISVDATIYSPTQAQAQAIAWSCVHDSQLLCNGQGDWGNMNLRALASDLGSSELYGSAAAGQWQCHELHVRLDDPGAQDGLFEVYVDDQLEVALEDLEFVNAWADAELNNVRFSSFWNAPAVVDHYIDDVVVSTSRVGCGR